MEKQNLT